MADLDAYRLKNATRMRKYNYPRSTVAFIVCRYCAELFCARSSRAVTCPAPTCRRRFNAERAGRYSHARRAKIRGAEAERFDPIEVFERDAWTCGICELPVDRTLSWPDPGSPSLDHIVPLALGGDHSRVNTQCAHLYCNSVKGARLTA